MITSISDWTAVLSRSGPTISFPLIVGGLLLMFFGWRLWKGCLALAYGLVGMGLGTALAGSGSEQVWYAASGGILLGLAGHVAAKYAIALFGGGIGAGLTMLALSSSGATDGLAWSCSAAAGIGGASLAHLYRKHFVIILTALLGAALIVSGLSALAMTTPALANMFETTGSFRGLVIGFLILVPTVTSTFYQESDATRLHAEI